MSIFVIADLHLSFETNKPMNVFGENWEDHEKKIENNWRNKVNEKDLVILPGDFSWAMKLEDTFKDFQYLNNLPGKKLLLKGNHDYWWKSISSLRALLPTDFYAIQNDALKFDNVIVCGTRGWKGVEKYPTLLDEDKKIFDREVIRLGMTLENASKLRREGDKLVCMIHYPPVDIFRNDSPFSELIKKYKVDAVIYGHLHGQKGLTTYFEKDGIPYYLTSCDIVENNLTEIKFLN